MRRYIRLSYDVSPSAPVYPGDRKTSVRKAKEIEKGDSCNTFVVTLSNHSGTHVDAPRHFFKTGRPITEYSPGDLVFTKPVIVNCPKGPEEPVCVDDLKGSVKTGCDALLIRTGFSRYRSGDVRVYCRRNPYLTPRAAGWIRSAYPSIRALGLDLLSISSYADRASGREAHKILLEEGGYRGGPVLIIEDMYIPKGLKGIDELIVSPLYIEGADSAPCAVTGVMDD
jgi:kynurenine formamidase